MQIRAERLLWCEMPLIPAPRSGRRAARAVRAVVSGGVGFAAVLGALGLGLFGASACSAQPYRWAPTHARAPAEKAGPLPGIIEPARLFVLPGDREESMVSQAPDGTIRFVAFGIRAADHPGGAIDRSDVILPSGDRVDSLKLPPRLGAGFLFYVVDDGTTRIWRADEWTGPLEPLAHLRFEVSRLEAGFDRIYAIFERKNAVVAIDPHTGAIVSRGPLPRSSGYGAMAFADPWMGAIETDFRGVLVTFDAGASWRPVDMPMSVPGVGLTNGGIVLNTARGPFALDTEGRLSKLGDHPDDDLLRALGMPPGWLEQEPPADRHWVEPRSSPLGNAITRAVLSGYPDSSETALVAFRGVLARVRLTDGSLSAVAPEAYPEADRCQGVPLGATVGFICGGAGATTVVYRYEPPMALTEVLRFDAPRYIASSDNGALVIRGPCDSKGRPRGASEGRYCIRRVDGDLHEIRVRGDVGAERVVALADGRAAVVVPPRFGAPGLLTLIEPDGSSKTRRLVLPDVDAERDLLESGLWLDGFVETPGKELSGWVAGQRFFAGVKVGLDGTVHAGPLHEELSHSLLSGRFGLLLAANGVIRETTDGGATWAVVDLPGRLSEEVTALARPGTHDERGCTNVGCAFGPWARVGWGADPSLQLAEDPHEVASERAIYVRWSLECAPTGESTPVVYGASGASERPPVRSSSVSSGPRLETSAWRPFLGARPPHLRSSDLGFDFGTEQDLVQIRGYVWGPVEGHWRRYGRWQVRAVDRFRVGDAIWSTAPSRPPWDEPIDAAQAFASDPSHRTTSDWNAVLDPGGEGGVLVIQSRSSAEVYVMEAGRSIVRVGNADDVGLERPAGAVRVGDSWYVGSAPSPRAFRVVEIEGDRATLVGDFPRHAEGPTPRVVRSVDGDQVAIWAVEPGFFGALGGGDRWYVFPVDPASGRAQSPVVVPRDWRLDVPRPCEPDEDGWVLVDAVNPSVTSLDFAGGAEGVHAERLEARLIVGRSGLCVDALAAQVDGEPIRSIRPRGRLFAERPTVPLSLTDRSSDRRWGFRCSR